MSGSTSTTNKRQLDDNDGTISDSKRMRSATKEQAPPSPDGSSGTRSSSRAPSEPSSPVSTTFSTDKPNGPKTPSRRKRPGTTRKPNRYRGICWLPDRQSWRARIEIGGKREHLGYFRSSEEAAHSYDHRAVEHYGAAVGFLNFPSNHPHYACTRPSTFLTESASVVVAPYPSSMFGGVDMPVHPAPPSMSSATTSMPMNSSAKMWGNVMDGSSSSGSSSPTDLAHNALRDLLNVSRELQQSQMRYQQQQQQQQHQHQQLLRLQQQQHKTSSSDVLSRMLAVENNKRFMQLQQTNMPDRQHDPLALQRLEAEMRQRAMEQQQRRLNQELAQQLQMQRQLQARMALSSSSRSYAPLVLPNFNSQRPVTSAPLQLPNVSSTDMARLHKLMMLKQNSRD